MLLLVTGGLVALGIIERWQHRKNLSKIRVRIHVNGTRGKSSVTRLIAAGLRAGGLRTCAKTTGTLARMILPDGREYPIFRPSRPNVIEQLRIVRAAANLEADVLVIECMAVQPILQSLCESAFVRATHSVITNARPDHLDVMGPRDEDVARALAATVPAGGTIYTAEPKHTDIIKFAAEDRQSQLSVVSTDDIAAITSDELSGFSYLEHAENVATALKVCADLGVDRRTALTGMWAATPDPGVLTAFELSFFGRHIVFVNAFAANDPDSTERIWRQVRQRFKDIDRRIIVVNCRSDRPDRSQQLGWLASKSLDADHFVLMGDGTYIFGKSAVDAGIEQSRIHYAEGLTVEEVFEIVADLTSGDRPAPGGPKALVIGIANIGGLGLELVRFFRNRSQPIVWPIGLESARD